ncbi:hypothetical protein U9M48_036801 [Paspalum notatum var. saurae]|uniref:DUF1618 domain-containing protein n=1 Tax=Paspalum notatum var. saurae TaxID=547442 RepID=A0AAQ3UJW5_PASNO
MAAFRLRGSKSHQRHEVGSRCLVACTGKSLLVLYGGQYSGPGSSTRGCYLVYDAAAPLLSTVPPPPQSWDLISIGVGPLVLRRQPPSSSGSGYLLAELVTRPSRDLPDAELYLWRSDGEPTPQWVKKEVRLPRKVCPEAGKHNFSADISFSGPGTEDTLCWVDLLHGILVCTSPTHDPSFCFIPLPHDCPAVPMTDSSPCRPHMDELRSVACVGGAIKLAAMVGVLEGWSLDQFRLSTWTLSPDLREWRLDGSFHIKDLWATDEYRALNAPLRVPICPILSLGEGEDAVFYAVVNDLELRSILQGPILVRTDADFKCQLSLLHKDRAGLLEVKRPD